MNYGLLFLLELKIIDVKILIMDSISDNNKLRSFENRLDFSKSNNQYLHSLASLREILNLCIKSFFEIADIDSLTLAPILVAQRKN